MHGAAVMGISNRLAATPRGPYIHVVILYRCDKLPVWRKAVCGKAGPTAGRLGEPAEGCPLRRIRRFAFLPARCVHIQVLPAAIPRLPPVPETAAVRHPVGIDHRAKNGIPDGAVPRRLYAVSLQQFGMRRM